MLNTRIKICGVTTPEDAELCAALGVDYIGLIFADSVRRVTLSQAAKIRAAVPHAMLVGVFMDQSLHEVVEISRAARVNMVQLHGDEPPSYCEVLLAQLQLPIVKSFTSRRLAKNSPNEYSRTSYFHLDLDKNASDRLVPHQETLWSEAAALRSKGYRIFLAGALNTGNVRRAMNAVRPYCVDVASAVESAPGIKDYEQMRRLVMEVRR